MRAQVLRIGPSLCLWLIAGLIGLWCEAAEETLDSVKRLSAQP